MISVALVVKMVAKDGMQDRSCPHGLWLWLVRGKYKVPFGDPVSVSHRHANDLGDKKRFAFAVVLDSAGQWRRSRRR